MLFLRNMEAAAVSDLGVRWVPKSDVGRDFHDPL